MIVVTGATGNVGRALVELLTAGGEQVTAVSRGSATVPAGARHVRADLGDPASLRPALESARALFLLVAGDDPEGVLSRAADSGVRRVVLLSSQGAGTRPESYHHPARFEEAARGSGLEWTTLRPGGFHTNALAWAEGIHAERTVAAPFPDVGLPSIDPADIAEVAATVLRENDYEDGNDHAGRTYELTGGVPLTPRERAAAIGEALGEPVRFVEQTREEARARMLRFMPEPVVDGTLAVLGEPTAAELKVSPDVELILGRAPRTFADWAGLNVAAFR
ncbi:NAD-dependent epimerase/dehydratase family protein [Nonomuraea deserti]|uniref:NAD-dependent epimerase/dehydratase family protein n=1 Tax=Nonomuraea deserti TaxID=1848322 RepID=A0A4V2YBI3_9ACTN|nr:NAD-dependent epimerase/dehydratase family protein [Nonomuraea deserti]